jgi:acetyl-CoA acetyltransferase
VADAYICDAVRTPIGRYGGALSSVRTDDLGAVPMAALIERNSSLDPAAVEDVAYGCANQAGEDNRSVGRMSALLAGLPVTAAAYQLRRTNGKHALCTMCIGVGQGIAMIIEKT